MKSKTVYLSSTFEDLWALRDKAYRTIQKLGYTCIAMEDYVASDQRPLARCLDDIRRCDVYVGLFAWRYGYIPPLEENPEQLSITELEYRKACEQGKKILIFLLDERTPWSPAFIDPGIGCQEATSDRGGQRIRTLREYLAQAHTVSRFNGADELGLHLAIALGPAPRVPRPARLEKMPSPVTMDDFVGRKAELRTLKQYFSDEETAVVAVTGASGMGKSHLVKVFLDQVSEENPPYGAAQWKYAWSFYNQHTDTAENSSSEFFADVLRHFGFEGYYVSEEQRAVKLAEVLHSEKTILVLDGVDPLQAAAAGDPPTAALRDAAVRRLLVSLCRTAKEQEFHDGLVIVTGRAALLDLSDYCGSVYREICLGPLDVRDGADLLRRLLHSGIEAMELEGAVTEVQGQPLALTLLGRALRKECEGDIFRRDELLPRGTDGEAGDATLRLLDWHRRRWCQTADDNVIGGKARLSLLQVLSLVGRPMSDVELEFLIQHKIKVALPLADIGKAGRREVEEHLQAVGLLIRTHGEKWDTHPTVRRFFGDLLSTEDESNRLAGHRVLFRYFVGISKKRPSSAEEMESVTRAVHHACMARHFCDAYRLYKKRVARNADGYITENLGLVAWDLTTLSRFFPDRSLIWRGSVGEGLHERREMWLRSRVAYGLELQGRLKEAQEQRQKAVTYFERNQRWQDLADGKEKLALMLARTGDLRLARKTAAEAVSCANMARDLANAAGGKDWEGSFERQIHCLTVLGAICHRLDEPPEAVRKLFVMAEDIHRERETRKRREAQGGAINGNVDTVGEVYLHSEPGSRYCVVLLSDERADLKELLNRTRYMDEWFNKQQDDRHVRKKPGFLVNAVHELSKGRIHVALADRMKDTDPEKRKTFRLAAREFDSAITLVQQAHNVPYQCQPLLARADLKRRMGEYKGAQYDLDEVTRIAGEMSLYKAEAVLMLAGIKLERASKLSRERDSTLSELRNLIAQGEALITRNHYVRKQKDLLRLRERLIDLEEDHPRTK